MQAEASFPHRAEAPWSYAELARVSPGYSPLPGRLPTCYSPVRRSTRSRSPFRARLACVRHAASVHSEPGSNSPVEIQLEGLAQPSPGRLTTETTAEVSSGPHVHPGEPERTGSPQELTLALPLFSFQRTGEPTPQRSSRRANSQSRTGGLLCQDARLSQTEYPSTLSSRVECPLRLPSRVLRGLQGTCFSRLRSGKRSVRDPPGPVKRRPRGQGGDRGSNPAPELAAGDRESGGTPPE